MGTVCETFFFNIVLQKISPSAFISLCPLVSSHFLFPFLFIVYSIPISFWWLHFNFDDFHFLIIFFFPELHFLCLFVFFKFSFPKVFFFNHFFLPLAKLFFLRLWHLMLECLNKNYRHFWWRSRNSVYLPKPPPPSPEAKALTATIITTTRNFFISLLSDFYSIFFQSNDSIPILFWLEICLRMKIESLKGTGWLSSARIRTILQGEKLKKKRLKIKSGLILKSDCMPL